MTYIYGLCDPRDGIVRYVGKTNDPITRLSGHLYDGPRMNWPVNRWIHELALVAVRPKLIILETIPRSAWPEAERKWIQHFASTGDKPLLNVAPGGQGNEGAKVPHGEDRFNAKLTEAQVVEMRELRHAGWKIKDLAARFGVKPSTVAAICSGKQWRHAGGPITIGYRAEPTFGEYFRSTRVIRRGEAHHKAKLTESDILRIRDLRAQGAAVVDLAVEYNCSPSLISDICIGKSWTFVGGPLTKHFRAVRS